MSKQTKISDTEGQKFTAIYVRRSVSDRDKGNNSLSIDSQIADCINSLAKGETYQVYKDDGKSGKDIDHRPEFQRMMADAKAGPIQRVIVKKYDRFARNIRDSINAFAELEQCGIGVYSLTEAIDTSTESGRMMLHMLLSFSEFERETIAARVADAYNTKAMETGFYQGGKVYYGYVPERRTVNGKTGSVLVPSNRADVVRPAYRLYRDPGTSLADILNYFRERGIDVNKTEKTNMDRSHLSLILKSPLYVKADKGVYEYLMAKGYEIVDGIEAFDGVHGCFRHKRSDCSEYIKVGYHEGLVDSETWLAVQDKKSHNQKIPNNGSAKNSWLVGLVKYPYCHYTLSIVYGWNVSKTKQWRYYHDNGADKARGCLKKRLKVRPDAVEQIVFNAMKERLDQLEIAKLEPPKPDTEMENMRAEILQIEGEIHKLMGKVADADGEMFVRLNEMVNALGSRKNELEEKIQAKARKRKDVDTAPLTDPLSRWDTLSVDEKHDLAVTIIEVVYVSDETGVEIQFSI